MFNLKLLKLYIEASCLCRARNKFWHDVSKDGWALAWYRLRNDTFGYSNIWENQINDLITIAIATSVDHRSI